MGVIENILLDVEKLKVNYSNASRTMRKRICDDLDSASSLEEALEYKFNLPFYTVDKNDPNLFVNQVLKYLSETEAIAEKVIEMFKSIDFYCYRRSCFNGMNPDGAKRLLMEFLEYFLSDLINVLDSLVREKHFIFGELDGVAGETYVFNTLKAYYVLLNEDYGNVLNLLETIVHELLHVYSYMFLGDYRYNGLMSLGNGFFGEALPLYAELSFFDFLRNRGIFGDDLLLHRNCGDYCLLSYFKTVNYVAKVVNRDNVESFSDNVYYRVKGDISLPLDKGLSFFDYPIDKYERGFILDFRYAMSTVDAFKLLEREQSGENIKKIVNEYLIGFQEEGQMDRFLSQDIDLRFMKNNIDERLKTLAIRYPIPGYHIEK